MACLGVSFLFLFNVFFFFFKWGSFGLALHGLFFTWIEPIIPYPLCFSLLFYFLYVVSIRGLFLWRHP